jgi:hypothetical protein
MTRRRGSTASSEGAQNSARRGADRALGGDEPTGALVIAAAQDPSVCRRIQLVSLPVRAPEARGWEEDSDWPDVRRLEAFLALLYFKLD